MTREKSCSCADIVARHGPLCLFAMFSVVMYASHLSGCSQPRIVRRDVPHKSVGPALEVTSISPEIRASSGAVK